MRKVKPTKLVRKLSEHTSEADVSSDTCHLKFFPVNPRLEDGSNHMLALEDNVTLSQVEEDLLLYGRRRESPDSVEIDEAVLLAGLSPQMPASEFKAAVDRSAEVYKEVECKDFNNQAMPAMEWNSAASLLDIWLNQSAVPMSGHMNDQHASKDLSESLMVREEEEIKFFCNVHVGICQEFIPPRNDPEVELPSCLELMAQIYYRNIRDRYPILPTYLIHRLAKANFERSRRLQWQRNEAQE